MRLQELVDQLVLAETRGNLQTEITGFSIHSATTKPGDLFVCLPGIPGFLEDRHRYAQEAILAGAVALIVEREVNLDVPTVIVPSASYALAAMACHFYGYPSTELKLIGLTGTNGKTTTAHMVEAILSFAGLRTGLMGNIGMKIDGEPVETDSLNTKETPRLQAALRQMRDHGVEYAIMEVTSQGLDMGRVLGCEYRTAVFTNLTQDHLDYHGSMEQYREAKGKLFAQLGGGFSPDPDKRKYAVLNADDPASEAFRRATAAQTVTYGIEREADVMARAVTLGRSGTRFELCTFAGTIPVQMKLVGAFNVSNALAAATCALLEGIPLTAIQGGLERLAAVPGRMEPVDEGQSYTVLVDYAHTPDSLKQALEAVRRFAEKRLIVVFGCGGDRDRSKRPVMGEIAAGKADVVILTSDNPRFEEPQRILEDIAVGVRRSGGRKRDALDQENGLAECRMDDSGCVYEQIIDRRQAIEQAIASAREGDIVLIQGKGHETYQIVQGQTFDFDDREIAREAIRRRRGAEDECSGTEAKRKPAQ